MRSSGPAHHPLLEVRRLSMIYPGTLALDDVSLAFEAGRVSAVVGRNGAGKSTLVKILSGAVRPTAGAVRLDGEPVELRSPHEARMYGIATVHQELSLVPGLSVAENLLLGRFPRRRGLLRAAIDWRSLYAQARTILDGMNVRLDVRVPVAVLSLAQKQMVEIARAASAGARAVVFDEPTASLARAEARTLLGLVRSLAERGVAVVYVTHRLGELAEIADTVTSLRDGRIAASIPGAEASPERLVTMMYGEDWKKWGGGAGAGGRAAWRSEGSVSDRSPSSVRETVIEIEGLGLGDVLSGVSFSLGRGEILGIAGMLGSGRTELLECLFGARRADRGRMVLAREPNGGRPGPRAGSMAPPAAPPARPLEASSAGRGAPSPPLSDAPVEHQPGGTQPPDIDRERGRVVLDLTRCTPARMRRLGLALVPEDRKTLGLVLGLPALDNLSLASFDLVGKGGFLSRAAQRKRAMPVIRDLDVVAADLDAPVSVLSGGNQQKIVLGKWLLRAPRVLLCDEPTRGIDVHAKRQMFEILRTLGSQGVASIVVSSELEELIELCDRILVLHHGAIAAEASPRDLTLERLVALCMAPQFG